mmetsp:Transcript_149647/g.272061  ORF Transcript_149647/g.272061 Transcript_149647/m.272061 type:complete len:200 (-) Transcript_149647:142-741(-)
MFRTPQEARDHMRTRRTIPAARVLADRSKHAQKLVDEQAAIRDRLKEEEKLAQEILNAVLNAPPEELPSLQWMYADCATGVLAYYDPLRWSSKVTFQTATEQFTKLAKEAEEAGKPHRPVFVKSPPGLKTKEEKFQNYDAIVAHLKKRTGEKEEHNLEVAKAQYAYEQAKDNLAVAEFNLADIMSRAEEAAGIASQAGA